METKNLSSISLQEFQRNSTSENPRIRALALRSFTSFQPDVFNSSVLSVIKAALGDRDPFVRKTAVFAVQRLWQQNPEACNESGMLLKLEGMLDDKNPVVLANALAVLSEVTLNSTDYTLSLNLQKAQAALNALNDCNEWAQVSLLEAVVFVETPLASNDAEQLLEKVTPRLQHANSAVALSAIRASLFFLEYASDANVVSLFYNKKLRPPLVTLLNGTPEVQYVALRNILLILKQQPDFLQSEIRAFFCKYDDAIFVKMTKLEMLYQLAQPENVDMVLTEAVDYATEVDVQFARKAVQTIGRLAIKIESTADACVDALRELLRYKVSYIVQECVIVLRDIFRRYPTRHLALLGDVCECMDVLDEAEAKAAMIWMLGQYVDRIENADELLSNFVEEFVEAQSIVQLSLLTAVVKLFVKRPARSQELLQKIFKWATESVDDPDVRDRAFFYWRLLSADPVMAKECVCSEKIPIAVDSEKMPPELLKRLLLELDSLASIYHQPASTFISKSRRMPSLASPSSRKEEVSLSKNRQSLPESANLLDLWEEEPNPPPYTLIANEALPAASVSQIDGEALKRQGQGDQYSKVEYSQPRANFKSPSLPLLGLENVADAGAIINKEFEYQVSSNDPETNFLPTSQSNSSPKNFTLVNPTNLPTSGLDALSLGGYKTQAPSTPFFMVSWTFLEPQQSAKGVGLSGTFFRRNGQPVLLLQVHNASPSSSLSVFAIQLNLNSFGLVLHNNEMQLKTDDAVIAPGSSTKATVGLSLSRNHVDSLPSQTVDNLQAALNTSCGVIYFQTKVPVYPLFEENAVLLQSDWLEKWELYNSPPLPGKDTAIVKLAIKAESSKFFASPEVVKEKLWLNNVFTVAIRPVKNLKVFFYGSLRVLEVHDFLFELELDFSSLSNGSLTIRADGKDRDLSPLVIKSLLEILAHA